MNTLVNTKKGTIFILILTALLFAGYLHIRNTPQEDLSSPQVIEAYNNRKRNIQVEGTGTVIKILKDDLRGSRHQRIIVRINNGLTVLIAHNIDLAPRLDSLTTGDRLFFFGEYEWNKKGGVVHWTHRDPNRHHPDGWLRFQGRIYQ